MVGANPMHAFQESHLLEIVWREIQAQLSDAPVDISKGLKGVRLEKVEEGKAILSGRAHPEAQRWLLERIQEVFPSVQKLVWVEPEHATETSATHWDKVAQTPHNRFAFQLLQHLSPRRGRPLYNPLVFWGPPGSGKTTLILVYAHWLREQGVPVLYWSADRFMKDTVSALRAKRLPAWRREVLEHQVIILENFHELLAKGGFFQSEALALFEDSRAHVQWIFSAHHHPQRLRKLRDDFRSRLLGGLTVHIPSPDEKSRRAFAQFILERKGKDIPASLLDTLVHYAPGDLRVLEGWINQVLAHHDLQGVWPSWELLQEDLLLTESLPAHTVLSVVGKMLGVSVDAISGRSRRLQITLARRIAMFILYEDHHMSLREVGSVFDRHHTTVISNLKTLQRQIKKDPRILQRITQIRESLHGSKPY